MTPPPEAAPLEAASVDAQGRPLDLESRLAAMADMLAVEGLAHGRPAMQALAWWDEVLAPSLGCLVTTAGWTRSEEGPRSAAVDAVLDSWAGKGLWTAFDNTPLLSEDRHAGMPILERGRALCGVGPRTIHHAPSDFSPWFGMLTGLAQGFYVEDHPSPDMMDSSADLGRMLQVDPVFQSDPWEAAGGPAAVLLPGPPVAPGGPDMADVRGNSAGYALAYWGRMAGLNRTRNPFQGAWRYARLLASRAAKHFPEFGGTRYRDAVRRLHVVQSDAEGVITARFHEAGVPVAEARWRPAQRPHHWVGKSGQTMTSMVEDGALLHLEVAEGARGRGIGTVVLRHAIARGCVHAPLPPPGGARLWGRHGKPDPDQPGWQMERVIWPTCSKAPQLEPGPAGR